MSTPKEPLDIHHLLLLWGQRQRKALGIDLPKEAPTTNDKLPADKESGHDD